MEIRERAKTEPIPLALTAGNAPSSMTASGGPFRVQAYLTTSICLPQETVLPCVWTALLVVPTLLEVAVLFKATLLVPTAIPTGIPSSEESMTVHSHGNTDVLHHTG